MYLLYAIISDLWYKIASVSLVWILLWSLIDELNRIDERHQPKKTKTDDLEAGHFFIYIK